MQPVATAQTDLANRWRLVAFALLTLSEVFLTSFAFNFPTDLSGWVNPVTYAKVAVQAAIVAAAVMLLAAWPTRTRIAEAWTAAMGRYRWRAAVVVNIAAFAALLAASVAFPEIAENSTVPWRWFALYCAWLAATAATLALVAAPAGFWRWLIGTMPGRIATALASGVLLVLAGRLTLESWDELAGLTLRASHFILTLYERDVMVDLDRNLLGVGGFTVHVLKECSGYEGIGLVTAFLVFYCWLMRRHLRFPQALLLIPIGMATSWTLNSIRIALLVSVGAHVSPEIAGNGFHSQAGWIAFLGLAMGLMVLSTRVGYFRRDAGHPRAQPRAAGDELLLAYLAPFMALMATSMVASLFVPHDQWLYLLKVAAVAGVLWHFRGVYAAFAPDISPASLAVGAGIGIAWIITDPAPAGSSPLGPWLATLPAWLAVAWIACRGMGTIVLVPMAEELAFRGYLQRALVSRQFAGVSFAQLTWLSFGVTVIAFGFIHQRWLAAAIAGACYALLAYRTNRLSDAIAAHAASNAVIFIWAVGAGQWTLL